MKSRMCLLVALLTTVCACLDVRGDTRAFRFGTVRAPGTRQAKIIDVDPYAIDERIFTIDSRLKENLKELNDKGPSSSLSFDEGYSIFSDMVDMGSNSLTFFTLADASFGSVATLELPPGVKMTKAVDVTKLLKANRKFFPDPIVFRKANIAEVKTSDTIVGKFGSAFEKLGYATFAYQVGQLVWDSCSGKQTPEQVFGVAKNIVNTAVGKLGTSGLQLAFVGVFAIDYSLSKFGSEAQAQHTANIRENYFNYTYKKRTMPEWVKVLDRKVQEATGRDGADAKAVIEREIEDFAKMFWNDHDSAIETLRLEKWPSADEQRDLTAEMVSSLKYTMANAGVFERVHRNIMERLREEAVQRLRQTAEEFNKTVVCRVKPSSGTKEGKKSKYAGYTVCLRPVSGPESPWSFALDENGCGQISFTVLGFLQCRCPRVCELFAPGKAPGRDEPEISFTFRMAVPRMTIVLPDETGEDDQNVKLTPKATKSPAAKKASAAKGYWQRVEKSFEKGKDKIDKDPQWGTVHDNSYSGSDLHFRHNYKMDGGDKHERASFSASCSTEPPRKIAGNETLKFALTLKTTASTYLYCEDSACVFSDDPGLEVIAVTRSRIVAGEENNPKVDGLKVSASTREKKLPRESSGVFNLKMPVGTRKGQRICIYFRGCGSQTCWIYEWRTESLPAEHSPSAAQPPAKTLWGKFKGLF